MEAVHEMVGRKITAYKRGQLFFLSDFRGIGSETAIRKALSRLCKDKQIKRIAHGIYLVPEIDPVLGELSPSLESIAESIAKEEHIKIKPAGAYALNKLGLTTQVPTRLVYLTDGTHREIKVGNTTIKFKHTTPKKMALQGEISGLVIQALEEINLNKIDEETTQKIKDLLLKEDSEKLRGDIKLASGRISEFLYSILKADDLWISTFV